MTDNNNHVTYTAKITASPSTNIDPEVAAGSVDATIFRNGVETDMEVTLVTSHDGKLGLWGSIDHWCGRPDLLEQWAVAGADPINPSDEVDVEAATEDARSSIIDNLEAAVREANRV